MKKLSTIKRRDFLNGIPLTLAAGVLLSPMEALAATFTGSAKSAAPYPPSLTGLRGDHVGSFEVAHSVAWNAKDWGRPKTLRQAGM